VAEEAGTSVTLSCRYRTQNTAWLIVPAGTSSSVTITSNCVLIPGFTDNYRTDLSDSSCNLIINSLTSMQAGTYTCQDLSSADLPASSEIITLGD